MRSSARRRRLGMPARLLGGTLLAGWLIGNAIPWAGWALGMLDGQQILDSLFGFNLFVVMPVLLPAAVAAWIQAHDPDLSKVPAAMTAFSVLLITLVGYACLLPVMHVLAEALLPQRAGLPAFPASLSGAAFQALLLAGMVLLPAWAAETLVVKWATANPAA